MTQNNYEKLHELKFLPSLVPTFKKCQVQNNYFAFLDIIT